MFGAGEDSAGVYCMEVDRREGTGGKKQAEIEKDRERFVREVEAAEWDVAEVVKKRDEEMKKSGKFKKSEEEMAELEKVLVKIRMQVEIKNGTISDEAGRAGGSENELKEAGSIVLLLT